MSELPFFLTWSAQRGAEPVEITGGDGAWFTTAEGGRWLDLGSLSYQANLGHGDAAVIGAIQAQAASLCLAPPAADFPAKRELAEMLLARAPAAFADGRVFFTLGGAEAIENAMKIARLATGRSKFVSRYRSYHGASFGALSLTGDYRRPPVEPGLAGVARVLDDAHIPEVLAHEGEVAAVVLEAVVGANGVHVTPPATWRAVREACDAHGALLVVDEVLTGFGRTGRCLGIEHAGVAPDVLTVAKGLTGGYAPLGAVLVRGEVARRFDDRVLWAGLTGYAHPLGCAAGRAALERYDELDLYRRAASLEPLLLEGLRAPCDARPDVASGARGLGLLGAIDLALPPEGWATLRSELAARRLHVHASERRGTLIVAPPLVIREEELAGGLAAVAEAVVASGS